MSLMLIDGSALYYRSFYAFANRPLTAKTGEATSVAFGFFNSILRLIEAHEPENLAVVFDVKGKVFRHDWYPEYKANRKPMPEELAGQLPRLRELLDAWGLPVFEKDGYEADDIMATLAREASERKQRVWLYTGDKDFMQLLDERVCMLKPGKRGAKATEFTVEDVQKEYGLEPKELIDVFALSGDASDNIPGAPGVGPKTALKLMKDFGSLDDLLERLDADKLTPRMKRVLSENRDQILLSRRLFTIDDQVPVDVDWDGLGTVLPTGETVRALLDELDLRQVLALVDRVAGHRPSGESESEDASTDAQDRWDGERRGYRIILNNAELSEWIQAIPEGAPVAVDTETDDLRPDRARLVGVSLACRAGEAIYVPVLLREGASQGDLFPGEREQNHLERLHAVLAPLLADPAHPKVGQNLKYDEWILDRHDLPLAGERFDTMLAAYVLDPGRQRFGLDELAREFLGLEMIPYKELFAAGDRTKDILDVPLDKLGVYAAEDAEAALLLRGIFAPELEAHPELDQLFRDLETPLSDVLFRMERRGIKVDLPFLDDLHTQFAAELVELESRCHEAAGEDFNVQSPKQLATVLFEKLGLKPIKKTSSGWSTDVTVLEALADQHPLAKLVLEHRQLAKLQGTYVENLKELAHPDTQLIHTSFNQAVAATGRLSSSDPNLQNIPVRRRNGRLIRRAFVPRAADHVFLSADYSQVELRLLAHLSGDERLIETFVAGGDVHRRTAALINEVAEDAVTSDMRSRAKAINFGVIYGMGARALARQIGVKVREASAFIDSYFRTYPGVKTFIDEAKQTARDTGETKTLLGRRRLLPDIVSDDNRQRSFQERIAVNTPIQGTAADLIKLAMLRVDADLTERGLEALLLLQVHDELLLEVPAGELAEVTDLVREGMVGVMELSVPLIVDIHTGSNWEDAHG